MKAVAAITARRQNRGSLGILGSLAPVLAALLAAAPLASADDTATLQQSQAYRAAVAQEALQKDMASVQAELASMREEMKKLLPGDVATIDRAFRQIDSLSSNEMKSTIESLRAASRAGDLKTQLDKLSDAYKSQTAVISSIKQISSDLTARRISDDITMKLGDILKRQVADMDEVARISRAGQPAQRPDLARRLDVVGGDQSGVTDDVKISIQTITDASTTLPAEVRKPMSGASAIIAQQKLAETADSAATLVRNGALDAAITAQASTANTVALVIHTLSSDEKTLEQLRRMSADLGTMSEEQKLVSHGMEAEKRNIPYHLQKRQTDLSDSAAALGAEVRVLNAQVAGEVAQGVDSMEKVVAITSQGKREDRPAIAPAQQTAVDALDAAKRDIDKMIADLEPVVQKELAAVPDAAPNAGTGTNDGIAQNGGPDANSGTQDAGAPGQGDPAAGAGQGQGPGAAGQGGTAAGTGGQGSDGPGMVNTTLAGSGQVAGGGAPGGLSLVAGFGAANSSPVQVLTGLNPHDRTAVAGLQNEKPPRQFAPEVQQYYKNLADGAGL